MPIFFGWGHQTTWNVGPVFRQHCEHCKNEEFWVLLRQTTWFTLFFIPIIPYRTEWWLLCPICKYGIALKSEQVSKLQPLAEANQLISDGKITDVEYKEKISALSDGSTPSEETVPALPERKEKEKLDEAVQKKSVYCEKCGENLLPEGRFCVHCGHKTEE